MDKLDIKLETVLMEDFTELASLLKVWIPKAKKEDTAVSAVVKIMQQRQQMLDKYYGIKPDEESSVEKFRKKTSDRRNKNKSNLK